MSQYRNISPYFESIFDCSWKHIYRHILPLFNPQPRPFNTEDGSTLLESEELATPDLMEEVISDRILLEQLFQRLRELDPDAEKINEYWKDDCSISDKEITKCLGRKQRTFADQMKKIRTELHKVRGY